MVLEQEYMEAGVGGAQFAAMVAVKETEGITLGQGIPSIINTVLQDTTV